MEESIDTFCKSCKHHSKILKEYYTVCKECGLMDDITHNLGSRTYQSSTQTTKFTYTSNTQSKVSKLLQIEEWNKYTKEEKRKYQLFKYIKEHCEAYSLNVCIIDIVCDIVYCILTILEETQEGAKRGKVKEGFIVTCIRYVCYINGIELNEMNMNTVDKKYIIKANKIIIELVNLNKIDMERFNEYVNNYNENIPSIMNKTDRIIHKQMMTFCKENDLLLEHSDKMIHMACIYYILHKKGVTLEMNTTIQKILHKLTHYETIFNNYYEQIC